ncbi:MAG: PD-(D/E)XK nuclease family protein [Azospirillum sp.]|nr:PD-(D/E)XK nuclease family protein [Azospirillum sp.]
MKTDENELALKEFLLDINCLEELLPWSGKFNLFDVLKASRNEIRHSNVLAWLLDANENHEIGDTFIKRIIQDLIKDSTSQSNIFRLLLLDFYSFSVYREWKNIDILMLSNDEKIAIAIENKVGSHEHDNQLKRYKEILNKEYPNYEKIFIYLTPEGECPSDDDWKILTYETIVENLEYIRDKAELLPDVKLMINNYIDTIRRDIVDDTQLIDICNKIYNKHKRALDLIYTHKIDNKSQIAEDIVSVLKEFADEGKLINYNNNFYTKRMSDLLPNLKAGNSSWGDTYPYTYWILSKDGGISIIFELGGLNVPAETMLNMQKLIDITKPNDKKREKFKYKRLHRCNYDFDESDCDNESIKNTIRTAVNYMLKWEKEILDKLA